MKKGFFIVFEGIDGSGKTTLAKRVVQKLLADGFEAIFTYEPTNGKWGKKLRKSFTAHKRLSSEEELELFLKDRKDHIEQIIQPALKNGITVVCDRYYYSTMAYQGARGIDPKMIEKMNKEFAIEPDFVFILEIPPEKALNRIVKGRKEPLNNFEKLEYLKKVNKIFKGLKGNHIFHINGDQPLESCLKKVFTILHASKNWPAKSLVSMTEHG